MLIGLLSLDDAFPSLDEQMQLILIIGARTRAQEYHRQSEALQEKLTANMPSADMNAIIVKLLEGTSLDEGEKTIYEKPENKVLFDALYALIVEHSTSQDYCMEIQAAASRSSFPSVVRESRVPLQDGPTQNL